MSETITFAFKGFQRVRIKEVDAYGFVNSRMNNAEGQNEYKVQFWLDCKRQLDWFHEFELEAAP